MGTGGSASLLGDACLNTRDTVPDPAEVLFTVQFQDRAQVTLAGHYWYNRELMDRGERCPAIVELNPYRRRDGMMTGDSAWYPYFAYRGYLCFRVDLQGSGDSEGLLTDEYTAEELAYCIQVIEQIARHPLCDGSVGMTGTSWSAINSLMVAAHDSCPPSLKAILAFCGTDDRYSDDVHYMNGAMTQDNFGWPASMWGWLSLPPDPAIVGDRWRQMWRERLRGADFWFRWWGAHPTRDSYWSGTSLLGRYDQVKVPVFIVSGYADGYKNPVPRAVENLAALGMPVRAALGPWGHHCTDPGPRFDWLPECTRWWDRWLKGVHPDPETELPQMTVWLGRSEEPDTSACEEEKGRWVAEDGGWRSRVREKVLYPRKDGRLSPEAPRKASHRKSSGRMLLHTHMLETSSYGDCGNDDLPGDQGRADGESLHFDTAPLEKDLDCFGYPEARFTLSCDLPVASIAVRLCEVSPRTGASHQVSYRFFNLCYRGGDFAHPEPVEPGVPFAVSVPLNILGHTFRKGWRIRLSVSPSLFPTMWECPGTPVLTLHTGPQGDLPASRLILPRRSPRVEDRRMERLLPHDRPIACVDSEAYVPTLKEERAASNTRKVETVVSEGREGVLVHKVFDSGRTQYGGPLQGLMVDEVAEENYLMRDGGDPLSLVGFSSFEATLERATREGIWRIRCETDARLWTEKEPDGSLSLRYRATLRTFSADAGGDLTPFEEKVVEGSVPRRWM